MPKPGITTSACHFGRWLGLTGLSLKGSDCQNDWRNQKSAWSQAPNSQGHRACDVGAGRREEGSYSFWVADRWVRPFSSVLHVVAANFLMMAVLEKCHRPTGLLKWNPLAVIQLIFWSKKGNGDRTSILKRLYTSKGIHFQLIFRTLYLHFQSQHSQSKLQSNASLLRSEFNKVVSEKFLSFGYIEQNWENLKV